MSKTWRRTSDAEEYAVIRETETFSLFCPSQKFEPMKGWHHFPKMNSAADDNCLTQFSAMGIGTKVSWNWGCCHCFSFGIWYHRALCFGFHILPTSVNADVRQQCNYKCIIIAVPNLISGIVFSVRCLENITDPFAKVHVSVWCGDWCEFKIVIIIHQKSMLAIFHSQIRHYWRSHRGQILGKKHHLIVWKLWYSVAMHSFWS